MSVGVIRDAMLATPRVSVRYATERAGSPLKYPRYAPTSFFGFAAQVPRCHAAKRKSYILARRTFAPKGSYAWTGSNRGSRG